MAKSTGSTKKVLEGSIKELIDNNNARPLFEHLESMVTSPDYCSHFIPNAFLDILCYVGVIVNDREKIVAESVMTDLISDLRIISDVSSLSTLEHKCHIKVVSILVSVMLTKRFDDEELDESLRGDRLKYHDAVLLVGSRVQLLLNGVESMSFDEERAFWNDTPVEGMASLADYCSNVPKIRNNLPTFMLPKMNHDNAAPAPSIINIGKTKTTKDSSPVSKANRKDKAKHLKEVGGHTPVVEDILTEPRLLPKGMAVSQMKSALQVLGLSIKGKKDELRSRLLTEGGYREPLKSTGKRKRTKGTKERQKGRTKKMKSNIPYNAVDDSSDSSISSDSENLEDHEDTVG